MRVAFFRRMAGSSATALAYSPASVIFSLPGRYSRLYLQRASQAAVPTARIGKKHPAAGDANSRSAAAATSRLAGRTAPKSGTVANKTIANTDKWRTKTLMSRPGFLIRRLYQIHVAIFLEECAAEAITPVQHSVLATLDQSGAIDQATLSRAVALDRTSVADIVTRLERRRLLKRHISPNDRRMVISELTNQGRALLSRLEAASARAHERTISALPERERALFLQTLGRLIDAKDEPPEA
jgi:MarR family transcriptional regulator, lower aerobic nicotinate degradation pathway regulator